MSTKQVQTLTILNKYQTTNLSYHFDKITILFYQKRLGQSENTYKNNATLEITY